MGCNVVCNCISLALDLNTQKYSSLTSPLGNAFLLPWQSERGIERQSENVREKEVLISHEWQFNYSQQIFKCLPLASQPGRLPAKTTLLFATFQKTNSQIAYLSNLRHSWQKTSKGGHFVFLGRYVDLTHRLMFCLHYMTNYNMYLVFEVCHIA